MVINVFHGKSNTLSKANICANSGQVRADGSSRFGAENKFGVFLQLQAAWNIKDEISWRLHQDWSFEIESVFMVR